MDISKDHFIVDYTYATLLWNWTPEFLHWTTIHRTYLLTTLRRVTWLLINKRHTIRGAADQREFGWSAGSGKSEVDRWRLEVGCQLLEVSCWLMEGDCYLLDVVASNTVSVIRTATSAVRLLLTHQRTIPWKASGAGVVAQRTHSWSVTTQYKIISLVTAVSTSLWLAVAGAPENSSLATPQQ